MNDRSRQNLKKNTSKLDCIINTSVYNIENLVRKAYDEKYSGSQKYSDTDEIARTYHHSKSAKNRGKLKDLDRNFFIRWKNTYTRKGNYKKKDEKRKTKGVTTKLVNEKVFGHLQKYSGTVYLSHIVALARAQ